MDKGHQIQIPDDPAMESRPANDMNLFHRKLKKRKNKPGILMGVPDDGGKFPTSYKVKQKFTQSTG